MRTQMIETIDTGVDGRLKYETHKDFAIRQDKALTQSINDIQRRPAWQNWDLLSVAPAGSAFPPGFFVTLWEYDDDRDDTPLSMDSSEEIEAFRDGEKCEDGDTSPHIQHGEVIRVNGVRFRLVGFTRDGSGSFVDFLEEDAMHLEDQDVDRPAYPRGPRVSYARRGYGLNDRGRAFYGPRP